MYATGELLDSAVRFLERAYRLDDVQLVTRKTARALMSAHGVALVLREGDQCYYLDEDGIAPLWKGQRFPITECISGWAMLHRQATAIPDITCDPRVPQRSYAPTFVRSLAMVPVRQADPIGAIGTYWANVRWVPDGEIAQLQELAEAVGRALVRLLVPAVAPSDGRPVHT